MPVSLNWVHRLVNTIYCLVQLSFATNEMTLALRELDFTA